MATSTALPAAGKSSTAPVAPVALHLQACCPSCGQRTKFTLIGAQRWRKEVAELTGMPMVMYLYLCGSCESTISLSTLNS